MIYDYYCPNKDCGKIERDVHQLMSDPAPKCPDCGQQMERLYDGQTVGLRGLTTPGRKD